MVLKEYLLTGSISATAKNTGHARNTVRRYVEGMQVQARATPVSPEIVAQARSSALSDVSTATEYLVEVITCPENEKIGVIAARALAQAAWVKARITGEVAPAQVIGKHAHVIGTLEHYKKFLDGEL